MFSILNQQVVRLDQLVQDVLNVARLETGELSVELEPLSVTAVIDQVLEQVRARNTSRPITFLEKPGLPYVYADRAWVAEVLINLIDNADKYSPPGEEISLELSADQKTVSISVRDHGPGVPKAEQALTGTDWDCISAGCWWKPKGATSGFLTILLVARYLLLTSLFGKKNDSEISLND
jgi:two-component system sensor histidine kinase KdpD